MAQVEKRAGGEILGRLAGLASRPFVGAAKSQGVQKAVAGGITRGINQPIEKGLRAGGIHKAISKVYEHGMRPIPGTPKLVQPVLPLREQRAAYGRWRADDIVRTLSENPEIIGAAAIPLPGTTEAILGTKHLLRKALGIKTASAFADEIEKIVQSTGEDPIEAAYWNYDARKKGYNRHAPQEERDAFKSSIWEMMNKTAAVQPYQQQTQWTCSAACLKAVVAHHGVRIPEEVAVELVGARPGRGAECNQIAEAARKLGFLAFEYSFASVDQAKFLLDQDLPIICDIQSFNNPGKGHYVVMVDADDRRVELMDPNTPGNWRVISRAEMEARWWDRAMAPPHELMPKWGIVIVPPED